MFILGIYVFMALYSHAPLCGMPAMPAPGFLQGPARQPCRRDRAPALRRPAGCIPMRAGTICIIVSLVYRGCDERVKYLDVYECFMDSRLLSVLIVLLLAFSLSAACTGTGEPAEPTTPRETATTAETPVATTAPVSLTPGPTQTAPPGKEVDFQIEGGYPSRITHDLTITFSGGKGQDFITNIDVRVTKSTGEVITESLPPIKGEEITLQNAKGENRVEITVSFITGGSFKVVDKIVEVP